MKEVKITGVVVCFNEERDIERCITSLQQVCDEVVVVDSYSTDSTPEICRSLGVKFSQHEFEGYIEQKVHAASLASHDVILSLDADEALSEELIGSIRQVKSDFACDAYYMNRFNNYCGKWIHYSGWYPDRKLRLFDYSKAEWAGRNPHDKVIMNDDATTGLLKGDILHYSYYTFAEHLEQVHKFSDIASRAMYDGGKRSGPMKILYKPLARFFKAYLLKLGILDGMAGFTISRMTAYATYLKYKKLYRLQKSNA
jgi:glycosyltransferase involved in cell wall biosynthesis